MNADKSERAPTGWLAAASCRHIAYVAGSRRRRPFGVGMRPRCRRRTVPRRLYKRSEMATRAKRQRAGLCGVPGVTAVVCMRLQRFHARSDVRHCHSHRGAPIELQNQLPSRECELLIRRQRRARGLPGRRPQIHCDLCVESLAIMLSTARGIARAAVSGHTMLCTSRGMAMHGVKGFNEHEQVRKTAP